jgi:hypothetical protein
MLQGHCGTRVHKLQQEMPDVELNKKPACRQAGKKWGRAQNPKPQVPPALVMAAYLRQVGETLGKRN